MFVRLVAKAKVEGKDVEVDDDIINYFNVNGLGKNEFFHYNDVRVFKKGAREETVKRLKIQVNEMTLGKEGVHFQDGR